MLRHRILTVSLGLVVSSSVGCSSSVDTHRVYRPAYGRPATCPDRPMVGVHDQPGLRTRDAERCSYSDANRQGMSELSGRVLGEGGGVPGVGVPLEGVQISLHPLKGANIEFSRLDPAEVTVHSDAQGRFRMSAYLKSSSYLLLARDPDSGARLGFTRIKLETRYERELKDVQIMVAIDPNLKADPSASKTATTPQPNAH